MRIRLELPAGWAPGRMFIGKSTDPLHSLQTRLIGKALGDRRAVHKTFELLASGRPNWLRETLVRQRASETMQSLCRHVVAMRASFVLSFSRQSCLPP